MRKNTKILLTAAAVFCTVGIASGIAGFCAGFRGEDLQKIIDAGSVQMSDFSWNWEKDSLVSDIRGDSEFEETYTEVEVLQLDAGVARCTFHMSGDNTWRVTGSQLPSSFLCRQKGTELEIKCRKNAWGFFGIGNKNAVIDIWIPGDKWLKEAELKLGVGSMETDGSVLRCEWLEIDCGVGDIRLAAEVSQKAVLEGGVGDLELVLAGQENDYDYEIDCGVGSVQIGEKQYSGLGKSTKLDHGSGKKVNIECGVGDIIISFQKEEKED